ncbi:MULTISPECIES: alpha/beta hydrolase [Streptomyces]|uniref:alpha/beta hydrolase n=1 Tax=Streptomyces TaxID=1883 RepID=UPI0014877EE7|nr:MULTISPECIES: alpha/beta hydrolase [Streptomyces]
MTTVDLLDLNDTGHLLDPEHGAPVASEQVSAVIEKHLRLHEETTDIFLYVHGWRTSNDKAEKAAARLFQLVEDLAEQQPHAYPRISPFRPQYVCVRWPSGSAATKTGYRTIRDRTAAMAHSGHASHVLAAVLGYFNERRTLPETGPDVLRSSYGQYLHAVGHSFGGRFLTHAIEQTSNRLTDGPDTFTWPWKSNTYPWTLDSLTIFQMAVPADAFTTGPYACLLNDSVLNAPITMTFSPHDRALGLWHRQTENGHNGIGFLGATGPQEHLHTMPLQLTTDSYAFPASRLINIDASAYYRSSPLRIEGAHSDYFRPESAHLLLSLANHAR